LETDKLKATSQAWMLQKLELEQALSQAAVTAEELAVFLTDMKLQPSQTAQGSKCHGNKA